VCPKDTPETRTSVRVCWDGVGVMVSNAADEIILEPGLIARHYLRSWFFLDLVSSLPLDYFLLLIAPETGVRQLMHAG